MLLRASRPPQRDASAFKPSVHAGPVRIYEDIFELMCNVDDALGYLKVCKQMIRNQAIPIHFLRGNKPGNGDGPKLTISSRQYETWTR